MYPAFVYRIYDRFELMPLVLKITCGATFILGALQLIALLFPGVSPQIEGTTINTPILMVLMGCFHIIIGWAIYEKQKWVIPLIVFTPIFQYGILFLEQGLPSVEALKVNLLFTGIWLAFFASYFLLGRATAYFSNNNA